jgi:hypothetical protein
MFSWIFFKSESINHAFSYISLIFSTSLLSLPAVRPDRPITILIVLFFIFEWFGRNSEYAIQSFLSTSPKALRWVMYYVIILAIVFFAVTYQNFIYFKL